MSADEIRLRIEEAASLIAGIAVDRISDDARFIEDLGLDSLSIIDSLVFGHEFRGGRRAVTHVARPVPPHGGERCCGVRLHLRPRDGHTRQRSSRDLGGQSGLHTMGQDRTRACRTVPQPAWLTLLMIQIPT